MPLAVARKNRASAPAASLIPATSNRRFRRDAGGDYGLVPSRKNAFHLGDRRPGIGHSVGCSNFQDAALRERENFAAAFRHPRRIQ